MTLTTANSDLKAILKKIVKEINEAKKIDLSTLNDWEDKLEEILPMFWFDLQQAQTAGNWALVKELKTATKECKKTLYEVRTAIFQNIGIISVNNSEIVQMNNIRQEIEQALNTEKIIKGVISLLVLLRTLII